MRMDNPDERIPVVDENGNVTGAVSRADAHCGSKILHPVVHLHLFNMHGDIYLQRRPEWKDVQPGCWDTATGGHVCFGESVEEALAREVEEELGITDFQREFLGRYVFESTVERELVFSYKTVYSGSIFVNKEELADGRFWTQQEINGNMGVGVFTPNFEFEYKKFIKWSRL